MIPFAGQAGVQITGNLIVHGVTKEVTFQGIATFNRKWPVPAAPKPPSPSLPSVSKTRHR